MRKILLGAGLALVCLQGFVPPATGRSDLIAEEAVPQNPPAETLAAPEAARPPEVARPAPRPRVERYEPTREERSASQAETARLIQQRAQYLARNRVARLESRKWRGVSPARPWIPAETYRTSLNPATAWGLGYGPEWFSK